MDRKPTQSRFLLSGLFLATAAVATLVAAATAVFKATQDGAPLDSTAAVSLPLAMAGIGIIMGVQHYQRSWGIAVGTITGALIGFLLSFITVAPRAMADQILLVQFQLAIAIAIVAAGLLWKSAGKIND